MVSALPWPSVTAPRRFSAVRGRAANGRRALGHAVARHRSGGSQTASPSRTHHRRLQIQADSVGIYSGNGQRPLQDRPNGDGYAGAAAQPSDLSIFRTFRFRSDRVIVRSRARNDDRNRAIDGGTCLSRAVAPEASRNGYNTERAPTSPWTFPQCPVSSKPLSMRGSFLCVRVSQSKPSSVL
jgi:hypothetical protein